MTAKEWVEQFVAKFRKQFGINPTPFDVARNLADMSDGNAMKAMVEFFERAEGKP
jgi:hypothetical protein